MSKEVGMQLDVLYHALKDFKLELSANFILKHFKTCVIGAHKNALEHVNFHLIGRLCAARLDRVDK